MPNPLWTYRTSSGSSLAATLARYGEAAAIPLGKALYAEANDIVNASVDLVPVDTGALKGSHYVAPPQREGSVISVVFGYGGPAARINPKSGESSDAYALYVHEDLEANHPRGGQAKYLEVPFLAAQEGMDERLANRLRGYGFAESTTETSPEEPPA